MILRDRLTVTYADGKTETLPASVGITSAMREVNEFEGMFIDEKLRAIVPPRDRLKPSLKVMWRDEEYQIDGYPSVRRRYGKDHHMTLTLKRRI